MGEFKNSVFKALGMSEDRVKEIKDIAIQKVIFEQGAKKSEDYLAILKKVAPKNNIEAMAVGIIVKGVYEAGDDFCDFMKAKKVGVSVSGLEELLESLKKSK